MGLFLVCSFGVFTKPRVLQTQKTCCFLICVFMHLWIFFFCNTDPVIFLRDGFPKKRYDMEFIYIPE